MEGKIIFEIIEKESYKQNKFKVPEEKAFLLADYLDTQKNTLDNEILNGSYKQMKKETYEQYKFLTDIIKLDIEPQIIGYKNSKEMRDDIKNNNHIYFFKSIDGFGMDNEYNENNNYLLEKTDIYLKCGYNMVYNDLFRVVHDYFTHYICGLEFGAMGEYNAFLTHSLLFSNICIYA